jgi:hypothetical protein
MRQEITYTAAIKAPGTGPKMAKDPIRSEIAG